jgi:hypothetical protein
MSLFNKYRPKYKFGQFFAQPRISTSTVCDGLTVNYEPHSDSQYAIFSVPTHYFKVSVERRYEQLKFDKYRHRSIKNVYILLAF